MSLHKILLSLLISLGVSLSPVYANAILTPMTDSVNSGIINTKMATSDRLKGSNIDATVINGVAIFRGQVQSKAQLQELIRIGRSVSGVKGVNTSKVRIAK